MKENAYRLLDELKIAYKRIEHPPMFTCEDAKKHSVELLGVEAKNLFIHNKDRSRYYLVIIPLIKRANLKELQETLGETRLSFGNDEELTEKLKACRGSVSLLNLANVQNPDVTVVIDKDFSVDGEVGFHPNDNTETVIINARSIPKILEHTGVKWIEI